MKALMLGGDFWHSPGLYYHVLKTHICTEVDFIPNVEVLRNINLDLYDILYIAKSFYDADTSGQLTQKSILENDEQKIKVFVENGKSLCILHAGSTIRDENNILLDLIKGRFINHPPICKFFVEFDKTFISYDSYMVEDELYHVTTQSEDTNVFAWAVSQEYGRHIMGWRHSYGKGKVAVFTLGHTSEVITSESYKTILKNMSHWLMPNK